MQETYLAHHGILGMKWGVRRFQNKDGTLTVAGKARYGDGDSSYTSDRLEAKYDRGRYLKEAGSSTRKQIRNGIITSVVAKRVIDTAGTVLVKGIIAKGSDAGKITALYRAVKLGKVAVHLINWGMRVKNISDMQYAVRSDKDYRRESATTEREAK